MNGTANHALFINYRRVPSASDAKLIRQELQAHFGADSIFLDTENILSDDYTARKRKYNTFW